MSPSTSSMALDNVTKTMAQASAVDARGSNFNDVHDNGYQLNSENHGPQTINTTINQYTQGNAKERQEFADWLSPLSFRQTRGDIYGHRREGTGKWVLDDKNFKDWQSGTVKTLWCPGIPGAGKTILASYIINHLEQKKADDVAVAYVYCSYMEQSTQTVYNLIASLLKQLVQDSLPTFDRVKNK
ncbi:hypothetical protein SERLA73DRAFT_175097 [Serpula lacrymans var. lacrymans S7.3]|uniref:Nephrocystin 3-like N-terminal domain-containing protein n=2 Tax=Serpula lacrymans var. lacrymans TaxID=341189 RepID=F8PKM8_SERL3|nr:uncharacterized protein SERLADRAFT_457071 [Serpula lacrymans var. lacrymans S7.9]EGO03575.1 hypothetical protein SERLA73DRAFT_175097 [Serpula lacrymans var. lacrymans S7.3]EGO29394.1 hypothetical protein SERLADRAFT_457071 [Serpula lacrymans var. lacrymans S7.9]